MTYLKYSLAGDLVSLHNKEGIESLHVLAQNSVFQVLLQVLHGNSHEKLLLR